MIEVRNLSYTYPNGCRALDDVSFSVERGKVVGIIGPNGSGKTTLVKAVAGLMTPSRGEVFWEDALLKHLSPGERSREIAYVPQSAQIPFPFTSLEVVLMGRAPYLNTFSFESKEDVDLAKEAMSLTDTRVFSDRCIQELSGGERQRVILARAFAQKPKFMILDEPTTSLDIRHQVSLYELLTKKSKEEGLTVVSSIHDLNIASSFCDRLILLDEGRLVADGSPKEILTEKLIYEIFRTSVHVGVRSDHDRPFVVPRFTS